MRIFSEIYSFRLNVVWDDNVAEDTKCHTGHSFTQFLWGTDWVYNQNMCLLDWVFRPIRKYKLPFSLKAATPFSINKCLKWSLKYVASKSILCFVSINTKNTLLMQQIKIKILSFILASFGEFSLL